MKEWEFAQIIEIDETSVMKNVLSEKSAILGYYDLLGKRMSEEPASGIYIIVYDNGHVEKRMK